MSQEEPDDYLSNEQLGKKMNNSYGPNPMLQNNPMQQQFQQNNQLNNNFNNMNQMNFQANNGFFNQINNQNNNNFNFQGNNNMMDQMNNQGFSGMNQFNNQANMNINKPMNFGNFQNNNQNPLNSNRNNFNMNNNFNNFNNINNQNFQNNMNNFNNFNMQNNFNNNMNNNNNNNFNVFQGDTSKAKIGILPRPESNENKKSFLICPNNAGDRVNIMFITGAGLKTVIISPINLPVKDLFKEYIKKMGQDPRVLGKYIYFLYNGLKIDINEPKTVFQFGLNASNVIMVVDTSNLLGGSF